MCTIALELALRRFPQLMSANWQLRVVEPQRRGAFVVNPDDELGFLYVVSADGDRLGFQNAEPWPEQASILLLGDSLLSGAGLGNNASFPRLIARALPKEPVMNLGLAGAGIERQLRIYRRYGRRLRSRLVVAALFLASDFENDAAFRQWHREGRPGPYDHYRNVFGARQRGEEPYADSLTLIKRLQLGRLLQKSRVYVRSRELVQNLSRRYEQTHRLADGTELLFEVFTVDYFAAPAARDDARIEALLAGLEQLRTMTTEDGAELLVMFIPSKEELFAVPPSIADGNIVARARERLREANFAVLDLYPAVRDAAQRQSPYFARDMHLNEFGNRVVADEFLSWYRTPRKGLKP